MRDGPRDVARRVLQRVEEGAYATLTLDGELRRSGLSPRDRGLCTELVYGTLRQRLRLDRALSACSERGIARLDEVTRDALRLAAYQLLFLRTPAHAVVDDTVGAVRRLRGPKLAGFANAILRRLSAEGEPPLKPAAPWDRESLSLSLSLPLLLVDDALRRFGLEEGPRFLAALNQPAPTWLRLNTLRGPREEALAIIGAELAASQAAGGKGAAVLPSPRLPEAVRVEAGDLFRGAAYAAGWFTAQDLGAQLIARLALATPLLPGPILDACAGTGGKSTHLAQLTANAVDIDAADLSLRKLELCREHVDRLGCARVRTLPCDLTREESALRPGYALVLLDPPCSGLGVFRRHPEARWRLDPAKLGQLAALQRQMLGRLAGRVLPGGLLVYSVCTYTDEEGPAQMAAFLEAHPEFSAEPPPKEDPIFTGLIDNAGGSAGAAAVAGALRTWPHRDDADGFYALRLRRRA